MITLIIGENAYERDQAVAKIIADTDAVVERYHGNEMTQAELAQIAHGISLFNNKKIVIIRDMSQNKDVWDFFGTISQDIASETHIVVVEPKPDKRTKTYKALQKHAQLIDCPPFGERDTGKAAAWIGEHAREIGIQIDRAAPDELVRRIGIDQYALANELRRLAVMGDITVDTVRRYTETKPHDTAFTLLELALGGDAAAVGAMVRSVRSSNDAYMTLGLLVSQTYALAGLVLAGDEPDIAKVLGVHPFVLSKLRRSAQQVSRQELAAIVQHLTEADTQLKTSTAEPWLVIESTLVRIAERGW